MQWFCLGACTFKRSEHYLIRNLEGHKMTPNADITLDDSVSVRRNLQHQIGIQLGRIKTQNQLNKAISKHAPTLPLRFVSSILNVYVFNLSRGSHRPSVPMEIPANGHITTWSDFYMHNASDSNTTRSDF